MKVNFGDSQWWMSDFALTDVEGLEAIEDSPKYMVY